MKRTMAALPLENSRDEKGMELTLRVREPGILRKAVLQPREVSNIVSLAAAVSQGKPAYQFIPVLVFEVDPDGVEVDRVIALVPPGKIIESTNELVYRGELHYPDGFVFFLFEEIIPEKVVPGHQG